MPTYDDILLEAVRQPDAIARFHARTRPAEGGCRAWTAAINSQGYGVTRVRVEPEGWSEVYMAHRIAWMAANAALIPDDASIDHTCSRRACVNPEHLQPVSISENMRLAFARTRSAGKIVRLGTASSLREVFTVSGEKRFKVHFRDYVDDRMVQRSRTFRNREEAQSFRDALGARSETDLIEAV